MSTDEDADEDSDAYAALAAALAVIKPFDGDSKNGSEIFQRDLIRAWVEIKKIEAEGYLMRDHILATAVAARMVDGGDDTIFHPYSKSGDAILSAIKVFGLLARLSDVRTCMELLSGEELFLAELPDAKRALEVYDNYFAAKNNQEEDHD